MLEHEHDSIKDIVDIDTFGEWVIAWRESVMKDPQVKHFKAGVPLEHSEIIGAVEVNIEEYPWQKVPENLQSVISSQYGAAEASNDKNLEVTIHEDELVFTLASDLISKTIDTYSETYVGSGVKLKFGKDSLPHLRGQWNFTKAPAITKLQIRNMVDSKDERARRSSMQDVISSILLGQQRLPDREISLHEFQTIAEFLSSAREYVNVTTLVPESKF